VRCEREVVRVDVDGVDACRTATHHGGNGATGAGDREHRRVLVHAQVALVDLGVLPQDVVDEQLGERSLEQLVA
jgi:hypothetical protein